MIIKHPFLSVPIYVCSESDFHKRIEKKRLESEEKHKRTYAYKKLGIKYELQYERNAWKYDKIIGWIEFYLNEKTIKADQWLIKSRRINWNPKNKNFKYIGKIGDVSITHYKNNAEIIDDMKLFLTNCQKGNYSKRLKKYYIDVSEFNQIAEFIDIKRFIDKITSRERSHGK